MRTAKMLALCLGLVTALVVGGCGNEMQDLRIKNDAQAKRIAELEAEIQADRLQVEQTKRQIADAQQKGGIEVDALKQQVAALEEELTKKKELLASMQQRLLAGGVALPVELSTKIEDFAKANGEMVSFDADRGIIKFKSDLLFEKGSDVVAPTAAEAVKALCAIMNSEEGKRFDIIIAGHTDDIPIQKPDTRAKHPTNWHLSAHRAISVLDLMAGASVEAKRLSVRGFGEYRPIAENAAGKKGNPQNRRVEIYVVAEGT
jgi:chemotaxis protein MotB